MTITTVPQADPTGEKTNLWREIVNPSYSELITSLSPVVYWRLNELTGTTLYEEGDNSRDFTLSVGTLAQDPLINDSGTSILFPGGSNVTASLAISASVDPTDAYDEPTVNGLSVETWIHPTNFATAGSITVIPGIARAANTISNSRWELRGDSIGGTLQWKFALYNSSYAIRSEARATSEIVLNRTYHLVGVIHLDGSTELFVNGVSVGTGPANGFGSSRYLNYRIMQLGSTFNYPYLNVFRGLIGYQDDTAIYSYALTPAQILNNYNTGKQ